MHKEITPILNNKFYDEPSVFLPENLLLNLKVTLRKGNISEVLIP